MKQQPTPNNIQTKKKSIGLFLQVLLIKLLIKTGAIIQVNVCEHKNLECTGVSNFTTDWRCKDCGESWEEDKTGVEKEERQKTIEEVRKWAEGQKIKASPELVILKRADGKKLDYFGCNAYDLALDNLLTKLKELNEN